MCEAKLHYAEVVALWYICIIKSVCGLLKVLVVCLLTLILVVAYTANYRTLPIIGIAERRGSCLIYVQCAVKYTEEDHASSFTRFLFALTGELPLNRDWKTYIY